MQCIEHLRVLFSGADGEAKLLRINRSRGLRPEGSSGFVTRLFVFEHGIHHENRIRVPAESQKQRAALLRGSVFAALLLCCDQQLLGQATQQLQLRTPDKIELHNVKAAAAVDYRGRRAMLITDTGAPDVSDAGRFAVVQGSSFQDGAIDVNLTGGTAPDARPTFRGFVGIAFRVSPDRSRFECFYLRPKNGRSEDQLQRNHSAQYISMPGFPWDKLRSETPGKYESYVDLMPGEWTHVKIRVTGSSARLYVNGETQPTLIVNDLKQPVEPGAIALWIGPGTIAYFSNLSVTR